MSSALGIGDVPTVEEWQAAASGSYWITIRFGDPAPVDHRQPFVEISRFMPEAEGFQLECAPHQTDVRWGTVKAAADELEVSCSTLRRLIDSNEKEYGESLVRYTSGKHRRINLALLRHLRGS